MKESPYAELIADYLQGSLSDEQQQKLNRLIADGRIDSGELEALHRLSRQMDELPEPEPSPAMRDGFYATLAEQQAPETNDENDSMWPAAIHRLSTYVTPSRAAAAVLILFIGFAGGRWSQSGRADRAQIRQLSADVSQLREMMTLTLVQQSSATERLKAVNMSAGMKHSSDKVLEALLQTLNNDPSVNVRLAAVDALIRRADNPVVREGLVRSITRQESPLVQIALADAMVELQEHDSVGEMQKLLQRNHLNPSVKSKIQHSIAALI